MRKSKIGQKLRFKKFDWVIVREKTFFSGYRQYFYKVYRKYPKIRKPLSNTDCCYPVADYRWSFLERQLKKDKNYHYTMHLWSGCER